MAKLIWGVLYKAQDRSLWSHGSVRISSFTDKNLHLNAASHIERFLLLQIFLTFLQVDGAAAGVTPGVGSRSHEVVVYAHGLSSISGRLLVWGLALAELSPVSSWRNEGFPCGWADGTPPALAWGGVHMVLTRS